MCVGEGDGALALVDSSARACQAMRGAATLLEALSVCGDLGHTTEDALWLLSCSLEDAAADLAAANGPASGASAPD